ncbi:carboxypeptidase Q-like, partial [Leptonychotes weddellii]|uniref:Carboxypeptidase Q-like n=1 Tax=Leptonychotes weddellii TaxID=9713 RepID=A0A7F8QB87_LEPWE
CQYGKAACSTLLHQPDSCLLRLADNSLCPWILMMSGLGLLSRYLTVFGAQIFQFLRKGLKLGQIHAAPNVQKNDLSQHHSSQHLLSLEGDCSSDYAQGITAEVLVVTSFEELQRRAPEARGKIVVYNQPYVSYSKTVQYRVQGAVEAAKVGALASLIRSVASFSIYSPHTGIQEYQDGVPKIPTACITVEDAEMMSRMASRGNRIVIQLKMAAKNYPDADSFNTVAEIIGSKYPEQVNFHQPTISEGSVYLHIYPCWNILLAVSCYFGFRMIF